MKNPRSHTKRFFAKKQEQLCNFVVSYIFNEVFIIVDYADIRLPCFLLKESYERFVFPNELSIKFKNKKYSHLYLIYHLMTEAQTKPSIAMMQ